MFDDTHVMTARKAYADRAQGFAHEPRPRSPKSGSAGRIVAGAGGILVKIGAWRHGHGASTQVRPTSVPATL